MSSDNEPRDSPEVSRASEPPAPSMEEDLETADPMSATFEVEYLMNVRLKEDLGSDVPLLDYRLKVDMEHGLWKFRQFKGNNQFDDSKEDYWLFSVHVNAAEMFFLIGGENAAFAKSVPNWHDAFTDEKTERDQRSSHYSSRAKFGLKKERLVAVRAPKATNPAITVWGSGNYAALNWVGLFVKSANDGTNEFIAVRTNKKLLPKYDDRGTVSKMQGADVSTGRTITLFPKQLFGTKGNNRKTYDKFVTDDPHNKLGNKHWASIPPEKRVHGKYPSHTWNKNEDTLITSTSDYIMIGGGFPKPTEKFTFNYANGSSLKETDTQGLEMLTRTFGSLLRAILGLARGDFAQVLDAIMDIPDDIIKKENPDAKGLVTAVVEIGKALSDKAGEKKINTDGVKDLVTKLSLVDTDFGSG